MAATTKKPQVFISFRGADVRDNFISSLAPALRKADINVFIDEDELLGTDLLYLLQRIEDSEIALVIFSKNYSDSHWCLDEVAKMKERKDKGRLIIIPIFYKIQPDVVSQLREAFGDNFRDLKRSHQHEPERTKKWEEALTSIPNIKGMPFEEQSEETDEHFIDLMVVSIQKLLANMAERGNQAGAGSSQGGSMVPARQQVNRQGGSMVPARQLDITHIEDSKKWAWSTIREPPNYEAVEVAKMIKIYWLKIFGTYTTGKLTPGTKYEAVFLVKLEDDAYGWEQPVTLKLKVEQHNGSDNRVDRTANLKDYIGHNWVDILAGVFVAPPKDKPAKITFTMYQYIDTDRKKGLLVKGVAIRPIN